MEESKELMYMLIWLMFFIACACLDSVIGIVILEAIDIKHVIRTELLEKIEEINNGRN